MIRFQFKTTMALLSLMLVTPSFAAPKTAKKATLLEVDTAASQLKWVGKKVTGQHEGTVPLKSGSFEVVGQELKGGTFALDMQALKVVDIKDDKNNAKLVGHLKSEDFFAADKNPLATIKITNVKVLAKPAAGAPTHEITGDLTIKGITNPITFPATVEIKNNIVKAKAAFNVDRTKYSIKYNSGKFFPSLGDKMISDEFNVELEVISKASAQNKVAVN